MRPAIAWLVPLLFAHTATAAESLCAVKGPEYLADADFALEAADKRSKHWTGIQHAGERSFVPTIEDGVLRIEKVGTQPWYIYRQRMKPADMGGKRMVFSAELKLDLTVPELSDMEKDGGGLQMTVRTRNGETLYVSFPHEPHIGQTDWFPAQLVVKVPRSAALVEPAIRHQADGSLQVRKLSFREADGPCKITPGLALK